MSDFILSCCSTADLDAETVKKYDLHSVCFHYYVNDVPYEDDFGASVSYPVFYQLMRDGAEMRTSQVNQEEFEAHFEPFLREGKDILHVCLSSGLSGVGNSAALAQAEMRRRYPKRKILILDSLCASSGYGLLMTKLSELRAEGKTVDEVYAWGEKHKLELNHWFFSSDLSHYIKGGRIMRAAGAISNMLHICPVLNMDDEGHLRQQDKVRTTRKAMARLTEEMAQRAKNGLNYAEKCFISHSDCLEEAMNVKRLIEEQFAALKGKVQLFNVGTVIGSHTGPGTVALFFWGGAPTRSTGA